MRIILFILMISSQVFGADRIINGINVKTLQDLTDFLIRNQKIGLVTSTVDVQWQEGMRSVSSVERYKVDLDDRGSQRRRFTISADEISELGGTDTSPTPFEYLLHAMGSSIIAAGNIKAVLLGIPLTEFKVSIQADFDLHSILGVDAALRLGVKNLRTKITIGGEGNDAMLRRIAEYGYDSAPIVDSIERSFIKVPVPEIIISKPAEVKKK